MSPPELVELTPYEYSLDSASASEEFKNPTVLWILDFGRNLRTLKDESWDSGSNDSILRPVT